MYNIVDSMYVSAMGEKALKAGSLVFPLQNIILSVAVGVGVGMNSLISRAVGAGRGEVSAGLPPGRGAAAGPLPPGAERLPGSHGLPRGLPGGGDGVPVPPVERGRRGAAAPLPGGGRAVGVLLV